EKVPRVLVGPGAGGGRVVGQLVAEIDLAGDAEVLDSCVLSVAGRLDVRADVVVVQVPADVPVELPVDGIARIAVLGAPHLHRALRIAREGRHARRRVDGRVDAPP